MYVFIGVRKRFCCDDGSVIIFFLSLFISYCHFFGQISMLYLSVQLLTERQTRSSVSFTLELSFCLDHYQFATYNELYAPC